MKYIRPKLSSSMLKILLARTDLSKLKLVKITHVCEPEYRAGLQLNLPVGSKSNLPRFTSLMELCDGYKICELAREIHVSLRIRGAGIEGTVVLTIRLYIL